MNEQCIYESATFKPNFKGIALSFGPLEINFMYYRLYIWSLGTLGLMHPSQIEKLNHSTKHIFYISTSLYDISTWYTHTGTYKCFRIALVIQILEIKDKVGIISVL